MTDILMSCLPMTKEQEQTLKRMLGTQYAEGMDIDRETANHFIKQLWRKKQHLPSDLDIECQKASKI